MQMDTVGQRELSVLRAIDEHLNKTGEKLNGDDRADVVAAALEGRGVRDVPRLVCAALARARRPMLEAMCWRVTARRLRS